MNDEFEFEDMIIKLDFLIDLQEDSEHSQLIKDAIHYIDKLENEIIRLQTKAP